LVGELDPTIGDEIKKIRPAVVVSRDAIGVLALRVVVPVTAWQDRFTDWDWLVRKKKRRKKGVGFEWHCLTFVNESGAVGQPRVLVSSSAQVCSLPTRARRTPLTYQGRFHPARKKRVSGLLFSWRSCCPRLTYGQRSCPRIPKPL
jgi:hypothetical protein